MEPPATERVRNLTAGELDWTYVLEVCRRHGVGPLLYRSLKIIGQHAAPPSVMKQLQEHFYLSLAHNLRLEAELTALLGHFRTHGIRAIPFKGPALATFAYGDLALRVFGDLDIFIQKENIQRALEMMISLGYRPDFHLESKQLAGYLDTFYEVSFNGIGKAPVEIHWELYADHFAFPVAPLSLWHDEAEDRSESTYRSVPPEKLFLMLCVHGTQHYWGRLSWICDMAELLRKQPDFDWGGLLSLATEAGGQRMLFLGLSLAHGLLDAPVPDEILHRIERDRRVKECAQTVRSRLFDHAEAPPSVLGTCVFYVKMRERLRDKARVCFRTFSRPIPGEWDQLGLDGFWARFGNVIRHVLMSFSYGLGLARQRLRTR